MDTDRSADVLDPALLTGEVGPDSLAVWRAIEHFGLERNIAELETLGYTVVRPSLDWCTDLCDDVRDAVLDVAERRSGTRPDLDGIGPAHTHGPLGRLISYLLFEHDVFQRLLLDPVVMTFVTYMLGVNATVSSMQAQIKGAGADDLPLHADSVMMSSPFATSYQLCNVSMNLTRYTPEDGSICFVPGSHRLARQPTPFEALEQRVPVVADPGSLIVFTGNTWHGAFRRRTAGCRGSLLMQFCRAHVKPFEATATTSPTRCCDGTGNGSGG